MKLSRRSLLTGAAALTAYQWLRPREADARLVLNQLTGFGSGARAGTVALWHLDGADGAQTGTVLDDSAVGGVDANTLTANGNAQADTGIVQSGFTSSGLFDGTGDWFSSADSADYDFGDADFTIDFWVYRNGAQIDFWNPIGAAPQVGLANAWAVEGSTAASGAQYKLRFMSTASGTWGENVLCTSDVPDATWTHIAAERFGDNLRIYFNGAIEDTLDVSAYNPFVSGSEGLVLGSLRPAGSNFLDGNLDEVRISKVARYGGANFTPPAKPYF